MVIAFASSDDLSLVKDPNDDSNLAGFSAAGIKSLDYATKFLRLGTRYQHDGLTITPWIGVDAIDAEIDRDDETKGLSRFDITYALRAQLDRHVLAGALTVGLDVRATNYDYEFKNVPPPYPGNPDPMQLVDRVGDQLAPNVGLYAEQKWQYGPVTVRPGVRMDYYGLADQTVVDPRLTVAERFGDAVVTQSLGVYHESPLVTDLDPIFGSRSLPPPESVQASASIEAPFQRLFVGQATVYAQQQSNLPVDTVTGATPISESGSMHAGGLLSISRELVDEQFGSYSYREYVGTGESWGIELMARRDIGRFTGWIAYAYARAWRTGDPAMDPKLYPYVLDQPHILTAVGTLPIGEHWRIGGRARLASGNPYTPVAGVMVDPQTEKAVPIDGAILSQRLPTFAQLDLRVDRIWRRRGGVWDFYLDVQNVTNNANVEGVTYSTDYLHRYYTTGLPIFPSLGVEYRAAQ
jgi:hypothetical protein